MADVHYVDVNSTNATPPYANWTTAATNIQHAVDAAAAGEEVVVTNGYYFGGVQVNASLTVRSVNGPQFTTIARSGIAGGCVFMSSNTRLSGFTVTGGHGRVGGGVYCGSAGAMVSNCVITGNMVSTLSQSVAAHGGGAYGVTLNNCTLTSNSVSATFRSWDGTYNPVEADGGGAAYCTLVNCTLRGNSANATNASYAGPAYPQAQGGGASHCTLLNCDLSGNSVHARALNFGAALGFGGGASCSTLNNCTLSGNFADWSADGGGASYCTMNNCIAYSNYSFGIARYQNYDGPCDLNYCCTTPQPTNGFGNITNAPLFVNEANGDLRLQSNSPCINAGNNALAPAGPDLDGNPRIAGGTVDLGAYEFQAPVSMISYAWLQQYGLPINSSTDTADPDGDGVDNYHEWLAGTNPINALSSPAQLTVTPSGVPPSGIILTWSTNAVGFTLQSTTNLGSPALWSTNSLSPVVINGQNTVTNPISGTQRFYRLIY